MTKRKMFLRMITASLLRRRSRMLVALLSIGIGATILSGLVTIYYDVPRQMGAQFRNYGANMILVSQDTGTLNAQSASDALEVIGTDQVIGATPYRYVTAQFVRSQLSFVAAGTDFDQVQLTSPYFVVDGAYPSGPRQVLIGKQVAETVGAKLNSVLEITYKPSQKFVSGGEAVPGATLVGSAEGFNTNPVSVVLTLDDQMKIASMELDVSTQTEEYGGRLGDETYTKRFIGRAYPLEENDETDVLSGATITSRAVLEAISTAQVTDNATAVTGNTMSMQVAGILDTGGKEESYIFMSMDDMAALTGEKDLYDVMELSVSGTADELAGYVQTMEEKDLGVTARLVKRITNSETAVLSKLQALVFLVTAVVLVLTMICVSTTMMAVVTERRKEIGLRKALGASDDSIRVEFLGEGMFLGALGGVMGALLGFGFAQIVSVNVFESSITFQPLLLPITVVVSMVIAALSCLWPIKRAVQIDPALVLKGE
ncbi:MAG: ABC transporter permease [Clostridia bacterium]|nr:ABC transporter permease [Clostridia bacterium]